MKKWVKNILIPVGVAVFSGIIIQWVQEYPVFSWLWKNIVWCFENLQYLLAINVPLLIVLLLFAILLLTLYLKVKMNKKQLAFLEYTSDTIKDYHCTWEWKKDVNGEYRLSKLAVHCPKEDAPLVDDPYSVGSEDGCRYKCSSCNKGYEIDFNSMEAIVEDNVRKKNFKNAR